MGQSSAALYAADSQRRDLGLNLAGGGINPWLCMFPFALRVQSGNLHMRKSMVVPCSQQRGTSEIKPIQLLDEKGWIIHIYRFGILLLLEQNARFKNT